MKFIYKKLNWRHLLSTSSYNYTSVLASPGQSSSPSSRSVISHNVQWIRVPSSLVTPLHTITIINYVLEAIIISSSLWSDVRTNLPLNEMRWMNSGDDRWFGDDSSSESYRVLTWSVSELWFWHQADWAVFQNIVRRGTASHNTWSTSIFMQKIIVFDVVPSS